jgi:hypothetical protein
LRRDTPNIETFVFRPNPNVKYIIFAGELSAEDRKCRVKADEPTAFGMNRAATAHDGRWNTNANSTRLQ